MQVLISVIVIVSAIWAAVDASRLGARRGAIGGGILDMGPAGWFFACLLVWIVSFPCYLATRPKLVRRAHALATHPQFANTGHVRAGSTPTGGYAYGYVPGAAPMQPYAPPPSGWYPSPDGYGLRWWDGTNWTSHST